MATWVTARRGAVARHRPWLAAKRFWHANFCASIGDEPILAQQIEPLMKFFGGSMLGWNLAISTLSAVEYHLLGDRRLLLFAPACWLLGLLAMLEKYRMGQSVGQATPQQKAAFFTRWMIVAAFSWIVLCLIVVPSENTVGLLFYSYGLGFVVAIHAATSSSYMPGYIWFVAPTLLAQTLGCAVYANSMAYVVGAITTPAMLGFMWILGKTFNQIQRSSLLLQRENQQLVEDLTEQTAQARAARAAAEDADAAKTRFLAAASHDLRQPIHAQGMFLDVLSRTPLDAQQRQLLDSVAAAGTASSEMLNTLLDFSRIDAGVIKPHITNFRVQSVLNKIEREFSQQADAKGLSYRSRESALVLRSDRALVELILRNLVSNAIRYTQRGGLLVVCRQRRHEAVLEVWDTGIGIAVEQQQAVFREFHQLGNPQRDRTLGLGLGLAIVHGLANTLGHALSLKSVVHRGSVFRLSLPTVPYASTLVANAPDSGVVQLPQLRVLVIDDDEAVRLATLRLLCDWGCVCEGAADIAEALELVQHLAPQLLISDYRLREERTGAQAIAAVRAALGADLPALLITGDTAPERLREATASGITLLHKPLSPPQLLRGIVTELRLSRADGCLASSQV